MFKTWRKHNPQTNGPDESDQANEPKVLSKSGDVTADSVEPQNNLARERLTNPAARDLRQLLLRGPKLHFVEDVYYNLDFIKYLVPTAQLKIEEFLVGGAAAKRVFLVYLENVANPGVVAEVKHRLKAIQTPILFDSSYIQRNIEDSAWSPFPQVEVANRPDTTQAALWQGRVALLLDGSPDVLLAPCTFFELVDAPDDAYSRWFFATSFFKITRYIMILCALCLPGFYIALFSYNHQLVPTRLLFLIISSREGTPFPIYFETFLMMGVAEVIRLMMLRVSSPFGSAVALFSGIALIIAGLYSHLIGAGVVIISTLTLVASFGIPDYDLRSAIRIFQFFTMIMSSLLGLFGFAAAFFIICIHLVQLKSFGIPYMAPLAPLEGSGWGHTILRENTNQMPVDQTYKSRGYGKKGWNDE